MLTDAEKTQVRFYLGQGSLYRYLNPRLEGLWAALDSDAENLVRGFLGQLQAIDASIFGVDGALGVAATRAGIKAVEEIQFMGQNGNVVDDSLRKIGRALVGRLSSLLGVPVYADVFGSQGWPGDSYSEGGLGSGRGGNRMGMG